MADQKNDYEEAYELLSPEEKKSYLIGQGSVYIEVISTLKGNLGEKSQELQKCNENFELYKKQIKEDEAKAVEIKAKSQKNAKKYLLVSISALLVFSILLIFLREYPTWQAIICLIIITGTVATAVWIGPDLEWKFAGPALLITAGIVTVIGLGIYTPAEIGQRVFDKFFKLEEKPKEKPKEGRADVSDSTAVNTP